MCFVWTADVPRLFAQVLDTADFEKVDFPDMEVGRMKAECQDVFRKLAQVCT